jgi:hypothetical protein
MLRWMQSYHTPVKVLCMNNRTMDRIALRLYSRMDDLA